MEKYPNLDELAAVASKFEAHVARPQPERGRYGWYKIVDKATGEIVERQRATNIVGRLDDKTGLVDWKARKAVEGVVRSADLVERIAQFEIDPQDRESKWQVKQLIEEALGISGGSDGALAGKHMHTNFEADDLGLEPALDLPEPYAKDVLARQAALTQAGLIVVPELIEAIVVNEALALPGTGMMDRGVKDPKGLFRSDPDPETVLIFDDKTGAKLHPLVHAAQMFFYASGQFIYDPVTHNRIPMPKIDQKVGIICHTPVGKNVSTLYAINIELGGELLRRYLEIENSKISWQVGYSTGPSTELVDQLEASIAALAPAENLERGAEPTKVADVLPAAVAAMAAMDDPFAGLPDENGKPQIDRFKKLAILKARIEATVAFQAEGKPSGKAELNRLWKAAIPTIPTPKKAEATGHDYTVDELMAIEAVVIAADASAGVPFPYIDDLSEPTAAKVAKDDERVIKLIGQFKGLPAYLRNELRDAMKAEKIPPVAEGKATEAHMPRIYELFAHYEEIAQQRADRIIDAIEAINRSTVDIKAVFAHLGVAQPDQIVGDTEELFLLMKGAIQLGWVGEIGGHLIGLGKDVLDIYGGKSAVLQAARREAKRFKNVESPKNADEVLENPILVALIAACAPLEPEVEQQVDEAPAAAA